MSGRIFISHRREDTHATASRLYDRLAAHFGGDSVFMDVDSIAPGYDFAKAIESAVGSCRVVLAVIGKIWLDAADERGWRRLDDPDDFVVLEIKAGLDRDIPVIPVLVGGRRARATTSCPCPVRPSAQAIDPAGPRQLHRRLHPATQRVGAHARPSRCRSTPEPSDGDIPPPTRLVGTLDGGNNFVAVAYNSDMRLIAGANSKGTFL